jgi:CBS-domain-containing membrane protein
MSNDIKVVHLLHTVKHALKIMTQYKIKKLPVVSDQKVVGIVTITDIAKPHPDLSKRFIESWVKQQWKD